MTGRSQRAKRPPTSAKGKIFNDPDYRPDQLIYFPKPLHYSNLSLVLQRTPELEAQMIKQQEEEGISGPLPEAVARRLRPTKVHFDWRCRRWVWKRFAENVRLMGSQIEGSRAVELAPEDRTVGFIRRRLPPRKLAHFKSRAPSDCPYYSETISSTRYDEGCRNARHFHPSRSDLIGQDTRTSDKRYRIR